MIAALALPTHFLAVASAVTADEWEWRNPLPQGNPLNGVVFNNNHTAWAVGNNGAIITSGQNYDAANWRVLDSGTTSNLHHISHSPQSFVVVGQDGVVLTSDEDGEIWRSQSSGVATDLTGVVWGGSPGLEKFIAVGATVSGGYTIINSTDGVTWHASSFDPDYNFKVICAEFQSLKLTFDMLFKGGRLWELDVDSFYVIE